MEAYKKHYVALRVSMPSKSKHRSSKLSRRLTEQTPTDNCICSIKIFSFCSHDRPAWAAVQDVLIVHGKWPSRPRPRLQERARAQWGQGQGQAPNSEPSETAKAGIAIGGRSAPRARGHGRWRSWRSWRGQSQVPWLGLDPKVAEATGSRAAAPYSLHTREPKEAREAICRSLTDPTPCEPRARFAQCGQAPIS